jgi:uncharacterized protein YcbK (DUF882 family)
MDTKYIPGTHILWKEFKCRHCGKLPPGFYFYDDDGEQRVSLEYTMLFDIFEELRKKIGHPLTITSGYRCHTHEKNMFIDAVKSGGTDSKAYISAHLFGLALDIKCNSFLEQTKMVEICRAITPRPRIGWQVYKSQGQKLIHIDVAYLIVPPYADFDGDEEW